MNEIVNTHRNEAEVIFLAEGAQDVDAYTFTPSAYTIAPGGAKSFIDKNGEPLAVPVAGLIIDSVVTANYWPLKDGNKIPFCSSIGGVYGSVNLSYTEDDLTAASAPRTPHAFALQMLAGQPTHDRYSCASCAMNQWGSAHQSNATATGKACSEKRRLLFVPDGWHMPLLLTLPTTSCKGWDSYCSAVRSRHGLPYYAFRISFDIERKMSAKNQPYGVVIPSMAGKISDEKVAQYIITLQKRFRELLRTMDVVLDESAAPGSESTAFE